MVDLVVDLEEVREEEGSAVAREEEGWAVVTAVVELVVVKEEVREEED